MECLLVCSCCITDIAWPVYQAVEPDALKCGKCHKFLTPLSLQKARTAAKPEPVYKDIEVSYKVTYAPYKIGWDLGVGEGFGEGEVDEDM